MTEDHSNRPTTHPQSTARTLLLYIVLTGAGASFGGQIAGFIGIFAWVVALATTTGDFSDEAMYLLLGWLLGTLLGGVAGFRFAWTDRKNPDCGRRSQ